MRASYGLKQTGNKWLSLSGPALSHKNIHTTGAYFALAGSGTGKTYTVIHRIENLVKKEHMQFGQS